MKKAYFIFIITFFISFFLLVSKVRAGECEGSAPACDCSGSRTEIQYRCLSADCGATIQKRTRTCSWGCSWEKECECVEGEWDCGSCILEKESCEDWGSPVNIETCKSWQKCRDTAWSESKPSCKCAGECLETPENPRYYNNPTLPTDPENPEEGMSAENIFLPVKLYWDNVSGFGQTEGPQSYVIEIEDTAEGTYVEILDKSEFISPYSCFLKSDFTHNWQVKACCGAEGTNCGSQSEWSFTTNNAPEPIEPADPDWAGDSKAKDIPLNVTLKWCESEFKYEDEVAPLSYKIKIYITNGDEACHPELLKGEECVPKTLLPEPEAGILYPPAEFSNEKYNLFSKETSYSWEVAACKDISSNVCTDWSEKWQFSVIGSLAEPELIFPLDDPSGNTPVGIPLTLRWKAPLGANSFIVEINDKSYSTPVSNLTLDAPKLSLDTFYKWKVQPCWDYNSEYCEDVWSQEWHFKTTGRPPFLISPEGKNILIPTKFKWENVSGAKSYNYRLYSVEKLIKEGTVSGNPLLSEFSLNYDANLGHLKQETEYSWQIQTCARENGTLCGDWSDQKSFTTFKLSAPENPYPEDNGKIYTSENPRISWGSVRGGSFYQYKVDYLTLSPEETTEDCKDLVGGEIVPPTITEATFAYLPLKCLGEYQWIVRACLDKDCLEAGDWEESSFWRFNYLQRGIPKRGGLVPCGRFYDDPTTPWNEREPCQFKHLFLLLGNIIDFLLWRVGLVIGVLLILGTGIVYYFSMGAPQTMAQVKLILNSAGKGYAILFLAWMIVSLLLTLLGYPIEIFGRWWKLKF